MATNTCIPLVDQAIETARVEGRPLTTTAVREIIYRDPWAIIRALDFELAGKRLVDIGIRYRLRGVGPAMPGADGYEHVTKEELRKDRQALQRVIAYRRELAAHDNEALREYEAMLSQIDIEAARVPSDLTGAEAVGGAQVS